MSTPPPRPRPPLPATSLGPHDFGPFQVGARSSDGCATDICRVVTLLVYRMYWSPAPCSLPSATGNDDWLADWLVVKCTLSVALVCRPATCLPPPRLQPHPSPCPVLSPSARLIDRPLHQRRSSSILRGTRGLTLRLDASWPPPRLKVV